MRLPVLPLSPMSSTWVRSTAGRGSLTTMDAHGIPSSTHSPPSLSGTSPSLLPTLISSTLPAAKACTAPTYPSATAFTSPPTLARPGLILVFATRNKSPRSSSIPAIPIAYSPPCSAMLTVRARCAASFVLPMAVRAGRKFSVKTRTPAALTFKWIRPIRISCTLRSGKSAPAPGKTIMFSTALLAGSSSLLMAETPGTL